MIFQEPMTSLNPLFTVGHQIAEAIAVHQGVSRREAMRKAVEMLRRVSIPQPEQRAHSYPHQMSGRHAPARHDRHGAVLQSQGADRRRADHGARRDDPGADPGADARAAAGLWHGHRPHHARHGRGGRERRPRDRHVCGQKDRGGRGRRSVRAAGPSLHARACSHPFRTWTRRPRRTQRARASTRSRAWCPRSMRPARRAAPLRRAAASPPTSAAPRSHRSTALAGPLGRLLACRAAAAE